MRGPLTVPLIAIAMQNRRAGERFEATPAEATVLLQTGLARRVEDPPAADNGQPPAAAPEPEQPPARGRRYRRRDLEPED